MRERIRAQLADRPRGELAAYAGLVLVALVLRLIDLGDRPFHHDESQDAYFSYLFKTTGDYEYQPLLHGPLRFYLTAAIYVLFGDSDFTARLAPALMGTVMVALPYGLRRQLGRMGAFAAALALAIGPSYLYYSRFAREDIYVACITLALLVVTFRFLDRPRRHHPGLAGALIALSFATKETTFITLFVGGTFFLVAIWWQARRAGWREAPLVRALAAVRRDDWAWGAGAYGLWTGLDYWLGQHGVERGREGWFFYPVVLFAHEWPVLLLAALGAAATIRRPTLFRLFLAWAFVVSLVVYSWAGEQFAWLVLHPLLPLILLAGVGVQAVWEARARTLRLLGVAACALGLAYTLYASWLVNVTHRADPRELLVATQSSEDVKVVADEVLALAQRRPALRVTIDSAEGATFPWAWYFRKLNVGYLDLTTVDEPPRTDVLILTQGSQVRLAPKLTGFDGRRFRFRVWWVRDYGAQSPIDWLRWFVLREPWNPTGGMPEWVYVRRVVKAPPE
jgi:predicted membrane-bound mannosyltransferase